MISTMKIQLDTYKKNANLDSLWKQNYSKDGSSDYGCWQHMNIFKSLTPCFFNFEVWNSKYYSKKVISTNSTLGDRILIPYNKSDSNAQVLNLRAITNNAWLKIESSNWTLMKQEPHKGTSGMVGNWLFPKIQDFRFLRIQHQRVLRGHVCWSINSCNSTNIGIFRIVWCKSKIIAVQKLHSAELIRQSEN